MAKFQYRMQNILNIKEKLEVLEKQEFALALAKEREEEERLRHLLSRKEVYEVQARKLLDSTLSILDIQENNIAIHTMDEWIVLQQQALAKATEAVEVARGKLKLAVQERKMHENLREKAFVNFSLEQVQQEYKETDELTSYRYTQKS